jgi:uncharacterized membrane protein
MISNLIKISLIILVLDGIYIQFIYKNFSKMIKDIQGSDIKINISTALLCYLCITFLLYHFIIKDNRSYLDAFILGFCTYGIYEFTNLSLLNNWNTQIAFIDTLWGGLLFTLTLYIYNKKIF